MIISYVGVVWRKANWELWTEEQELDGKKECWELSKVGKKGGLGEMQRELRTQLS